MSAPYDREALVTVLVYHWRPSTGAGCGCGWSVLGASHAEHIADVYEASVMSRLPPDGLALRDDLARARLRIAHVLRICDDADAATASLDAARSATVLTSTVRGTLTAEHGMPTA